MCDDVCDSHHARRRHRGNEANGQLCLRDARREFPSSFITPFLFPFSHLKIPLIKSVKRTNARSVLSTTFYTSVNVEYTTRLAKILARRMARPVYVGCSLDPGALGLMVEEEMEGLSRIVDMVMEQWK